MSQCSAQICRLCLYENEENVTERQRAVDQNHSLRMTIINGKEELLETIYRTTSLKVMEAASGLTQFLCSACETELLQFSSFRTRCQVNDQIFRSKFISPTSKAGKSYEIETVLVAVPSVHQVDAIDEVNCSGSSSFDHEQPSGPIAEVKSCYDCKEEEELRVSSTDDDYEPNDSDACTSDPFVAQSSQAIISKKFQCDICKQFFRLKKTMKSHILAHLASSSVHEKLIDIKPQHLTDDSESLRCTVCGKIFALRAHLQTHVRTLCGAKRFECQLCGKAFSRQNLLSKHVTTHVTVKGQKQCNNDRETSGKQSVDVKLEPEEGDLAQTQTKDMGKQFHCTQCDKTFKIKSSLDRHVRAHSGIKTHMCNICGKVFSDGSLLNGHLRTHTGEKPHQCHLCDKAFGKRGLLKSHIQSHTGEKPYTCDTCGKAYRKRISLVVHIRRHTGEKPYECKVCSKTFSHSTNLRIHARTHTGNKPHKCNVCGMAFSQRNNLTTHYRTHTGEKPYKCHMCEKAFNQSSYLKVHIRLHTEEKPYKCGACGKTYRSQSQLTRHSHLAHNELQRHVCETCGKGFHFRAELMVHNRTHTGEKAYKCDICGQGYGKKKHLIGHARTHEKEAEKQVAVA